MMAPATWRGCATWRRSSPTSTTWPPSCPPSTTWPRNCPARPTSCRPRHRKMVEVFGTFKLLRFLRHSSFGSFFLWCISLQSNNKQLRENASAPSGSFGFYEVLGGFWFWFWFSVSAFSFLPRRKPLQRSCRPRPSRRPRSCRPRHIKQPRSCQQGHKRRLRSFRPRTVKWHGFNCWVAFWKFIECCWKSNVPPNECVSYYRANLSESADFEGHNLQPLISRW